MSRSGANSAEVFGFVGYLTTIVAYIIYIIWAFVPSDVLRCIGVTYYPSKEWAIIVPTWLCMAVVFSYWVYESLNMKSVPSRSSMETIQDKHTKTASPRDACFPGMPGNVPPLVDIPADITSRLLFANAPAVT